MAEADLYHLAKVGRFWWCDFVLYGVHVHRSTKCVSKADAILRCKGWWQEIVDRHDGRSPEKAAPTLSKALDAWEKVQTGQVGDLYVVNMRCAVCTHAKDFLETPVDQLDNLAIMKIRAAYLACDGVGYRTGQDWEAVRKHTEGGANGVIKMLSALIGWCVEAGMITARPFKVKKLRPQPKPEGIVWPERIQEFYAEADRGGPQHVAKDPKKRAAQVRPIPHSAIAIRLMGGLGLREEEAVGALWEWLDRRRNVYIVGESKDRALREIPVPEWLMEFLEGIRNGKESGLILPAKDGRPHHKNFTQKPVDRIAAKLEIPGMTPHRLRATFATTHFEAGTKLSQIQQMMGHEDSETTMGYIVQRPVDQAEAQERVAELQGFKKSPKVPLARRLVERKLRKFNSLG